MQGTKDKQRLPQIEIYEYPGQGSEEPLPDMSALIADPEPAAEDLSKAVQPPVAQAQEANVAQLRAQFEGKLTEVSRRAFDDGREQGRKEERDAQSAAYQAREERHRQQTAESIANFMLERDQYLRAVEAEVVRLALTIAARILRREAQMDPLLLTGAVRVALGQLAENSGVRVIVPEPELQLWKASRALVPNLAIKPVVYAGEEMELGDCRIESDLGSVDLGLSAQLAEIERGLFDSGVRMRRVAHGKFDSVAAQRERF